MSDPKSGKKPQKLKARMPRGLADRGPAEIAATRAMVDTIRTTFERYGFDPVETPTFEYTDALGKFLPDQDRPNEGVFSFQDDDEQWISLRYDLTAPLARYVAENYQHLALPYRSYRNGYVYRNEKPGPGRFRQFMQFDADTVGSPSMAADAEMCMLAADTMEALGIKRGDYVVKVNNRKVLDGVMEAIGIGGDENAGKRLTVLRALDKYDRLGIEGVISLLKDGRKDESGDFTKGAGLGDEQVVRLQNLIFTKFDNAAHAKSLFDNKTYQDAIDELAEIRKLVSAAGYDDGRIGIFPSVIRGLEYYTGPVYEVELTFEVKDDKGRPVRFGSVGGGGRYDGLVSRFMGQPVPATGFSIGVSRLQAALTALGTLSSKPEPGPVIVTIMDRDNVAAYQRMVTELRNAGIRAELYLGNPKNNVGQQLKYADKRHSPCAIIQGSNERAAGQVVIKDLILGAELAAANASDREDYLNKQAEAQFPVSEADLVAEVRKVLARHART
ncbi:MAG TPA: histidine--tRNA ligase [Pseudolabrys sp.]|nr:histidine--tRNA ligase [Pseudolabrys sp.]